MPSAPATPPEPPPRGLLIASAAWVLLSLLVAYGLRPPVLPLATSYAPAARIALVVMLAGALIAWPLLRLSQRTPARPVHRTLLDVVVLAGALQVTLWPLRLAAAWPIERTVAADVWFLGWLLAAASAVMLGGVLRSHAARTLLMGVLLIVAAGPILLAPWLADAPGGEAFTGTPLAWLSPFGGLARLAAPGRLDLLPDERTAAYAAAVAGLGLSVAAALLAAAIRSRRSASSTAP
ncbi:MAG: hypothetical protein ACO3P9_11270 [Phycisphaerales bacterium]|jgi:hypothetical protein